MARSERVIEVVGSFKGSLSGRLLFNLALPYAKEEQTNCVCAKDLEQALGKTPRVGMKLALVDLAEYEVEDVNDVD